MRSHTQPVQKKWLRPKTGSWGRPQIKCQEDEKEPADQEVVEPREMSLKPGKESIWKQ